jgi:hypothetical protein
MPEFYYQIKGKEGDSDYSYGNWAWPPVFSGKVEAENKKAARLIIEEEYGKQFPLRVLAEDLDNNEFLMSLKEIKPEHQHISRLFDVLECQECGNGFRRIDLYNDRNERYKGTEYCGEDCRDKYRSKHATLTSKSIVHAVSGAVIYQITNKITGMCYIGKTTQAFTLRWYQHFYQGGGSKFHEAVRGSRFEDWTFSVIECVELDKSMSSIEIEARIADREQYWINQMDSIENGYNTAKASSASAP